MFDNFKQHKQRVAVYTRVSTEEQVDGNGLDVQQEAILKYIETHSDKYTFSKTNLYIDEGKSGADKSKEDRPALYKMYQDASNKKFDVVLVWKIDRFFRRVLFLLEGVETLDKLGVGFISITQPFDTTQAFGRMMLQMMGVIAELERDLIKERTHSGVLSSMKKGRWGRGSPPHGYVVNSEKNVIIDEDMAKGIRLMFELLVHKQLNVSQIVERLNKSGVTTTANTGKIGKNRKKNIKHTNFWNGGVVHRMLRREMYYGKMIQNRNTKDKITGKLVEKSKEEWIIGKCPAIISKDLFDKAQIQLGKNARFGKRNKGNRIYMLSTLLYNKEYGLKYTGYMSSKSTRNYRLSADKTKCSFKVPPKGISGLKIEGLVWNKVKQVLLEPKLIIKELEKLAKDMNEDYVKYQIDNLNKKKIDLEDNTRFLLSMNKSLSKSDLDMMMETINKNRETINKYESEIEDLSLSILSNKEKNKQFRDLKKLSKNISSYIQDDNITYELKTEICRALIEKIYISKDKLEIYLYVPITKTKKGFIDNSLKVIEELFDSGKTIISDEVNGTKQKFRSFSSELSLVLSNGTPSRI